MYYFFSHSRYKTAFVGVSRARHALTRQIASRNVSAAVYYYGFSREVLLTHKHLYLCGIQHQFQIIFLHSYVQSVLIKEMAAESVLKSLLLPHLLLLPLLAPLSTTVGQWTRFLT